MGVADNKTYKNQYHFNDKWFRTKGEDYPSINGEEKINSTIKENPEKSNVEIEGKEIVLQPDLSALFKAVGKRHSKGGMDVLLKPDSFVFSADKSLSFNERDHELFEFKKGGNFRPDKNTPADVLKRNIDVKHYNTLVNNINDLTKDDLAKNSSVMMLEKYIKMLGNIAYVQEEKKNFPQGLPAFSQGTAPVYDPALKQQIMETKQYAKHGGRINSIHNTIMELAGTYDANKCPCGGKWPNCTPCTPAQLDALAKKAKTGTAADVKGMNKIGTVDVNDIYHSGTDPISTALTKPQNVKRTNMSNDKYLKLLTQGRYKGASGEELARTGRIHPSLIQDWNTKYRVTTPGTDNIIAVPNKTTGAAECECGMDRFGGCLPCPDTNTNTNTGTSDRINPGEVTGNAQDGITADWEFTPWQKRSQALKWLNFANIQRYMPYRSHLNSTYIDPALLNEQQAVGNAKGLANQQLAALSTLNPILRNAQAASGYGQLLEQIPQIGLNVENQNVGIKNQTRSMNNQIRNAELLQNLGFDQQYFREAVEGRKNYNNMTTVAANEAFNLKDQHAEENQKLAYNLLTQTPLTNGKLPYEFDWRTGNFKRNPMSILDVNGRTTEDTWDAMVKEAERLSKLGIDKSVVSALIRGKFFQQAAPYFASSSVPFKKGGRMGKGRYK